MQKRGFTLAEVLITLGIIGVVAALSAPSLIQSSGNAQIGPKLAKAVSTLELANENMLHDKEATKISSVIIVDYTKGTWQSLYLDELANYMKISAVPNYKSTDWPAKTYNGGADASSIWPKGHGGFTTKDAPGITDDGMLYFFYGADGVSGSGLIPSKQYIGHVIIDINGFTKPNRLGKDVFAFTLFNDGSLKPVGSANWAKYTTDGKPGEDNSAYNWKNGTTNKCNETTVTDGLTCAGSIFENNLKVVY